MASFFNFDKLKKKLPFLHDSSQNGNGSFLSPFTSSKSGGGGGGSSSSGRKKNGPGHNLIMDRDPEIVWEILSEIGDGAFGKVYKARNKQNGTLAAAKIVDKCAEDELDDYMIEIDILTECRHKNIVQIYESYYYNSKLWVIYSS